jgi:hypothetical protein
MHHPSGTDAHLRHCIPKVGIEKEEVLLPLMFILGYQIK